MNTARLYVRFIGISFRSQMQYRASVLMYAFGQLLLTGCEFLAVWALFDRFGSMDGWRLPEVALLYGMANLSFAISEAVSRRFDLFSGMVKSGEFDRILLRPRGTAFQILASEFALTRLGRFTQGLVVLIWAVGALGVDWTVAKGVLLVAAVFGGACIFVGLFVLQATLAFWTTEGLEIANTVTYGGVETAQYPLAVYQTWFRRFFTFVVPLACMNYFPALAITGRADPLGAPAWLHWTSPILGFLFLAIGLRVWEFGVRHYRSTGS